MGSVSLCMIVKNEEKHLRECLLSVQGVADEIIVVDTGSTDSTKKIAAEFNSKIYDFEWVNDFSAARNFALSKTTSDWILYLDADERLDENSKQLVKRLAEENGLIGYFCNVVSPSEAGSPSVMKFIRFFRRHPDLRFSGKVHEQIEPSLRKLNYEIRDSEIVINHVGYDIDKEALKRKAERNLKLLLDDYKTNPSPYNAFQIGQTYLTLEDAESASKYFLKVLENPLLDEAHIGQTLRYLAAYEFGKKDFEKAKDYISRALELIPDSPIANILAANIALEFQDLDDAAKYAKIAYEKNRLALEGKQRAKFDILINEKNILLYGINLALLINNKDLFEYFYPKVQTLDLEESDKLLLSFYHSIYTSGTVANEILSRFEKFKRKIDVRILAQAVKYLNENGVEVAGLLAREFHQNFELLFNLGEIYLESNPEQSLFFLESAQKVNPADLKTTWNLFNLYFSKLDLSKLEALLSNVKKYHSDNLELINVMERIIVKLKNLPDVSK